MIPEATLKTKAPKGDSINKGAGSRANTYTLNPGYGEIIPAPFPSYPGSNEASGVPQTIINHIPQHEYYYELFLGNGTIARWKRPAHKSFLFDIDPGVIEQWKGVFLPEGFNLFCNS